MLFSESGKQNSGDSLTSK